jgi:hypothetical protein
MLRARLTARVTDMPLEVLSLVGSHFSAVDEARAACVCAVFRDTFVSTRAALRAELARVLTVAVHGEELEEFASECVRACDGGWATWQFDGGIPHRRVVLFVVQHPKLTAFVALGPVRLYHVIYNAHRGPTYVQGARTLGAHTPCAHRSSQHAIKYMHALSKTLTL